MNGWNVIEEGGPVMLVLLLASFLTWGIFLGRLWLFVVLRRHFNNLCQTCRELLERGQRDQVEHLANSFPLLVSRPYRALFEKSADPAALLARRLSETRGELSRWIWMLGTIAAAAPFIGLFGTVVGIIKSFDAIAASGKSGLAVVASGLSEALIATAAGIFVAVVALVFYNFLQVRLKKMSLEFQNKLEDLSELLK